MNRTIFSRSRASRIFFVHDSGAQGRRQRTRMEANRKLLHADPKEFMLSPPDWRGVMVATVHIRTAALAFVFGAENAPVGSGCIIHLNNDYVGAIVPDIGQ